MPQFKRIYKACIGSNIWIKFEPAHRENEEDISPETYYRRAVDNDETTQVETSRGWCSWGF